jgi:hypothetical protein
LFRAKLAGLEFTNEQCGYYIRMIPQGVFFRDINFKFLTEIQNILPKKQHKQWYKKQMDAWISGPGHPSNN